MKRWRTYKATGTELIVMPTLFKKLVLFNVEYEWFDIQLMSTNSKGANVRIAGHPLFVPRTASDYENIVNAAWTKR
jgi:hypothetical protein